MANTVSQAERVALVSKRFYSLFFRCCARCYFFHVVSALCFFFSRKLLCYLFFILVKWDQMHLCYCGLFVSCVASLGLELPCVFQQLRIKRNCWRFGLCNTKVLEKWFLICKCGLTQIFLVQIVKGTRSIIHQAEVNQFLYALLFS